MSPFERHYAWHVRGPLDVEAMAAAAPIVEGCHDFAAFQGAGSPTGTTERVVFSSRIASGRADLPACRVVLYEVSGNGFLRYMVRTIVGTLVEIGRGRRIVAWMNEVLASRDRARAGPTAPAEGLFLVAVGYESSTLAAEP